MKLYDKNIEKCLALLDGLEGRRLPIQGSEPLWPDAGDQNLILRGDMAYELGGGTNAAVSCLGITSSDQFVKEDELWLYGKDLPQIKEDIPYARLTFLKVAEDGLGEGDEAYAAIRKIEYTRYHINPKGYMMRISAANEREPVRIGKKELKDGLDFAKVGSLFLSAYRQHPKVLAAKMIFITLPQFPYDELAKQTRQTEEITESLNHIFKNLIKDCSVCNLKPLCDEVEGMRELHFSQKEK